MLSFRHVQSLWLTFAFTQGVCIASSILEISSIATAAALLSCVSAGTLLYKLQRQPK